MENNMHDIAFCGFIGSGKTYISNKLKDKHGGRIESIATPLKRFAQDLLDTMQEGLADNFKQVRKPEHRNFLVYIGEKLRDPNFGDPNFWIRRVNYTRNPNEFLYVDDLRHPNEALFMKANGLAIVRLDVSLEEQTKRALARDGGFNPSIRQHHSEISHLKINPDIVINVDNKTPEEVISELEKKLTPILKLKISLRKYWYKLFVR